MAVLFLEEKNQHDDFFGGAKLIVIYCKALLYMLDGILVPYACNQTC